MRTRSENVWDAAPAFVVWLGLALGALLVVFAMGLSMNRAVEAEGVEILGGPINLKAEGDTLTICGVARMSDGTYRLGHIALLLRADSDSTIVGYPKGMDVRTRCAPLLRQRGLPLDLPLTDIDWRQTRGIAVQPDAVT